MSVWEWLLTAVYVVVGGAFLVYVFALLLTFLGLLGDNAKALLEWMDEKRR